MTRTKKIIRFDEDAQQALLAGVDIMAKAVGSTLGIKGRNVAFDQEFGEPKVLHDGVSVAKQITLEDPFENIGAQLVKAAAIRTNEVSGDGTTTATILTQAIVNYGMMMIRSGANPMTLREEIEDATKKICLKLTSLAKPITKPQQIQQVARLSAQNVKVGTIVADAINAIGVDGVITVEDGTSLESTIEITKGMEFDRGYVSSKFVTDYEKMVCELKDPYFLFYDGRISDEDEMFQFMSKFLAPTKGTIVFITNALEGNALRFLALNTMKGKMHVVALKPPGFGERSKDALQDLAILTGGTVISDDTGISLPSVKVEHLGRADKIIVTAKKTTIIGGKGASKEIKKREAFLREEIAHTHDDWSKNQMEKRLARLAGGVAVIYAGAATEIEMQEIKERIIDAVGAAKAAMRSGVVQGGETALIYASQQVFKQRADLNAGEEIMKNACMQPFNKLCSNAYGEKEIPKLPNHLRNRVLDLRTKIWSNAWKVGIIDPVEVLIAALQNASSAANMILTTATAIVTKEEKDDVL